MAVLGFAERQAVGRLQVIPPEAGLCDLLALKCLSLSLRVLVLLALALPVLFGDCHTAAAAAVALVTD